MEETETLEAVTFGERIILPAPEFDAVDRVWPSPKLDAKLKAVRRTLADDDCFMAIVTARGKGVRWGKSSLTLDLAALIDEKFQAWQMAFTGPGFEQVCLDLDAGQVATLDEPGEGINRRRSMTNANIEFTDWLTRWGYRNVAGFLIHPHIGDVDRLALRLADAWIEICEKRRIAIWYDISTRTVWTTDGPVVQLVYTPRFKFWFPDAALLHPVQWGYYQMRKKRYNERHMEKPEDEDGTSSPSGRKGMDMPLAPPTHSERRKQLARAERAKAKLSAAAEV